MVNKYYTPEIEEFHIGFEFETAIIDCNWVNHGWENRIFDLDISPIVTGKQIGRAHV